MSDYAEMASSLPALSPYWFGRIDDRIRAGQTCFVLLNSTTKKPYVIGDDLPGELNDCLGAGDQILAYASARLGQAMQKPWHWEMTRA